MDFRGPGRPCDTDCFVVAGKVHRPRLRAPDCFWNGFGRQPGVVVAGCRREAMRGAVGATQRNATA
jgi:hypothetical protein